MGKLIVTTKIFIIILFTIDSRPSIAQWSSVCNTGNGFVDNFENYNGDLYATGFFTTICGTKCNYVAKYDGTNWQSVGNGFPNAGHHLSNIDNELYGVAYQPNIDSNWVYRFDGTNFIKVGEGTYLSNAKPGFSQTNNLYNIIKYKNKIIACGEFDRVGNKKISGIMQWDGIHWDSLSSGLLGNIPGTASVMYPHDLCTYGTDLIVSGNFKKAGGQIVNGIARWDGAQWLPMGQGFNSTVYAICVFNGELYAGGDFTLSGGTPLNYIAKWNGTNWENPGFSLFYINPNNYTFIHTLKVLDNKLFISGGFDRAVFGSNTMSCQSVASFDGTLLDTLGGGIKAGNEAEALAIYKGELYAGGGANNSNSYITKYNLPVGLKDLHYSNQLLNIYPNPTNKEFTITLPNENTEVLITDVFGQLIYNRKQLKSKVTIEIDKAGFYIIYATNKHGILTTKLIVNN